MLIFSERLKSRRHRLGLNQHTLASRAGASPRSLVAWESGWSNIPQGIKLSRLAEALGVDIQWLLGEDTRRGEGEPPKAETDSTRSQLWLSTETLDASLVDLVGRLPGAAAKDRRHILSNIRDSVDELLGREVSSKPLSEEQQILKRAGEKHDRKPKSRGGS